MQLSAPAVAAHDLEHEAALVRVRSGRDAVDGLSDAVQRAVRADRHVRAAEVVVDAAHEAHDVQVRAALALLLLDSACRPRPAQQE